MSDAQMDYLQSRPKAKEETICVFIKQNNTLGLSGKFLFHPAPALRHYQLKDTNKKPSMIEQGTLFPFVSAEQRSHHS